MTIYPNSTLLRADGYISLDSRISFEGLARHCVFMFNFFSFFPACMCQLNVLSLGWDLSFVILSWSFLFCFREISWSLPGWAFFFSLLVCILFLVLYLYVFHLYLEDREGEVIFSRSALFSLFLSRVFFVFSHFHPESFPYKLAVGGRASCWLYKA